MAGCLPGGRGSEAHAVKQTPVCVSGGSGQLLQCFTISDVELQTLSEACTAVQLYGSPGCAYWSSDTVCQCAAHACRFGGAAT